MVERGEKIFRKEWASGENRADEIGKGYLKPGVTEHINLQNLRVMNDCRN